MRLDAADWELISGCLVSLYRELDSESHARVMLRVLNELVPAMTVVLNYFTPPNKLTVITLPENAVTDEQVALVAKYGHQSPYAYYYLTTEDASWKMTTDFMPIEDFKKLELHRFGLGPLGINYQIGGMLASLDGTAHIITIHRKDHGFTEKERDILNALHPHLVTSHVNALAFSRSQASISRLKAIMETAPGAYGYFNPDGTVAWMQPRAQAWLLEFFPDEVKYSGNVPGSVANLVTRAGSSGGAPQHLERPGKRELLVAMVSASPLGGWVLRLERRQKNVLPRFRPLPQISRSENRVLRWMVEGKRNGEIAVILGLSPRTVEKHVQSILNKFDVENRATAIIRAMELCATPPT